MTDLQSLLDRVRTATGSDRELDRAIVDTFGTKPSGIPVCANIVGIGSFTGSVDHALALCAKVLPVGRRFMIWQAEDGAWAAHLIDLTDTEYAPTPALAVVAATIQALIAEGGRDE